MKQPLRPPLTNTRNCFQGKRVCRDWDYVQVVDSQNLLKISLELPVSLSLFEWKIRPAELSNYQCSLAQAWSQTPNDNTYNNLFRVVMSRFARTKTATTCDGERGGARFVQGHRLSTVRNSRAGADAPVAIGFLGTVVPMQKADVMLRCQQTVDKFHGGLLSAKVYLWKLYPYTFYATQNSITRFCRVESRYVKTAGNSHYSTPNFESKAAHERVPCHLGTFGVQYDQTICTAPIPHPSFEVIQVYHDQATLGSESTSWQIL